MRYLVIKDQILHITHNDSDAVGCALVIEYYAKQERYKTDCKQYSYLPIHNFNNVISGNQKIELLNDVLSALFEYNKSDNSTEFNISSGQLKKFKELTIGYNYDDLGMLTLPGEIIVTDLVIDITKMNTLLTLCNYFDIKFLYVDHHTSNLNHHSPYKYFHIESTDEKNIPRSACKYLFDLIIDKFYTIEIIHNYDAFYKIINDISRYDTWLWKTDPDEGDENHTAILIDELGSVSEAFNEINHQLLRRGNISTSLQDVEKFSTLIESNLNRKDQIIKKYLKNTVYDLGYNLGFTNRVLTSVKFALVILPENFGNDIMEAIYTSKEQKVDVVIGLYPSTRSLSFRRSYNCSIDVSKIAANYGGGGHTAAAGATLNSDTFIRFLNYYYKLLDKMIK